MTKTELELFIKEHLYNELKYLLCAAASWDIANKSSESLPKHFIVYTMDSAFLHARSLFEFFTYNPKNPKKKVYLVTWKNFGLKTPLPSSVYDTWMSPLHLHVMHLQNRLNPNNIVKTEHLKYRVLDFATEIVQLCVAFSSMIESDLSQQIDKVLEDSIVDAEGINPDIKSLLKYPHPKKATP